MATCRIEVMPVVRVERHRHGRGPGDAHQRGICLERPPREDDLVALTCHRVDELGGDLDRPGPDRDLGRIDTVAFGEPFAKRGGAHVGIAVDAVEAIAHGLDDRGQRRMRGLVRGELRGTGRSGAPLTVCGNGVESGTGGEGHRKLRISRNRPAALGELLGRLHSRDDHAAEAASRNPMPTATKSAS